MNQTERILRHLEAFGSITAAAAAAEFGCMRLASRANDLKKAGYPIRREMVTGRNRFGEAVVFAKYSIREVESDG